MIDVAINITGSVGPVNRSMALFLSHYQHTTSETPWKQMREEAIKLCEYEFKSAVFNLVIVDIPAKDKVVNINDVDTKMRMILNITVPSIERLKQFEYFQTYLGDMGSSVADDPIAIGFVDLGKKVRYEFAHGSIFIRDM